MVPPGFVTLRLMWCNRYLFQRVGHSVKSVDGAREGRSHRHSRELVLGVMLKRRFQGEAVFTALLGGHFVDDETSAVVN